MKHNKWEMYTAKEIKPDGWLKRQLEIQASGLNGNLDKVWKDVRDSAWLGGSAESWERVPYWLDGFIPLAYLLKDDDLISRANKYINAIIAHQEPDGWLCPCKKSERQNYDTWAVLLISKVLTVYYECSGDKRIPDVLYMVLKNFYSQLLNGTIKLFEWSKFRWFEGCIAIRQLYDIYHEQWIVDLANILKKQGQDYGEIIEQWKTPLNKWTLETHIVNLCMALKAEAVSCDLLNQPYLRLADCWNRILKQYNGTAAGLFTGDECLSGLSPIQGTELCAVVEQMYSYELLYAYTGNKKWAELLEVLAYNALPAALSDDMWSHQYVQQSNQIACIKFPGKSIFRTNNSEAHLFGLEPNYGCCTANFGQGWPKLTLSAFMHSGNTIISAIPLPSVLSTKINGEDVKISLKTDYPFQNSFTYHIDCSDNTDFSFEIRIPSFAKNPIVNGHAVKSGTNASVKVKGKMTIMVRYDTEPILVSRPYGLKCVKCGSLVFSLPIDYEKKMYEYEHDGVERKYPYCDYEYIGKSDWNYAFCSTEFIKEADKPDDIPFSSENPPITLKAKVKKIDWGFEDGYETTCAKKPRSRKPISEEQEISLYPYGCAKLRMTEMPLLKCEADKRL